MVVRMKILNKTGKPNEMNFHLDQDEDSGDIDLYIKKSDGSDEVLLAYIDKRKGTLVTMCGSENLLKCFEYDIENLSFNEHGCIEAE